MGSEEVDPLVVVFGAQLQEDVHGNFQEKIVYISPQSAHCSPERSLSLSP